MTDNIKNEKTSVEEKKTEEKTVNSDINTNKKDVKENLYSSNKQPKDDKIQKNQENTQTHIYTEKVEELGNNTSNIVVDNKSDQATSNIKEEYPELWAYTLNECFEMGREKVIDIMNNTSGGVMISYSCVQKEINNKTIFC